jgi:hypothetical protein
MGSKTSIDIIETGISIDQQLEWHLRGNHYPPLPTQLVAVCREVISHLNGGGDINQHFQLPTKVVTYKGQSSAPAWAIVEGYHLAPWIQEEEDSSW